MRRYYKIVRPFATASQALPLLLNGCAAGLVQGAVAVKDMGDRRIYQTAAEAGDPQAQFSPGDSWCCTATKRADNRRHAIYSNEKATEWLCRAALRTYGPAQMELARIYAGRPFRYNVMKQAADRVLGAPKDPAVALMWAEIAETNKVDGAARLRLCLMEEATLAV